MAILYWLKRPRQAVARIRFWLWENANPDLPWMCPDTIKFCRSILNKSMNAVEFGSGRSSRWFASHVGKLICVEHRPEWFEDVQQILSHANVKNVDFRLVPLDHAESDPEREEYNPVPAYVAVADQLKDQTIDFAVVDGHYRTHCVRHLIPKMKPGGYLLVDDINFWPSPADLPVPASWRIVDDSTNGIKRCIIWQAPLVANG